MFLRNEGIGGNEFHERNRTMEEMVFLTIVIRSTEAVMTNAAPL